MNRENLDGWCERAIVWLVTAILVIGPLATGAVHTLDFLVLQFLSVAAMLLWGVRLWILNRPKILWPSMSWAVLAFVALAVGRYLTCDIEVVGRLELTRILIYAFLYFVIVNNCHKQEHVQFITLVLVFLAMAIAVYALAQFFTGSNRVWNFVSPYKNRASGTYISPNHLGGFLEMVLPLAFAFSVAGRLRAWLRILVGYAGLVILAGIAVTVSRGAWLAAIMALVVLLALMLAHRQYRLPAMVVLAFLAAGLIFLLPKALFIRLRVERMFANNELNENMRYAIWDPAIRMWQDYPVWGVGPGHFDFMFRGYRPQGVQLQPDWVHNDYLNTLTDWGVVGAGVVACALVLLALGTFRTFRAVRPQMTDLGPVTGSNRFAFTLGATAALAAILVHSWVDFNMHIPANAILCVSLMALLASHIRFTSRQHWFVAGLSVRLLVTATILVGGAYLVWQGVRRANEGVWLQRASTEGAFSVSQMDYLKRAFEIEPGNWETAYRVGESYRVRSLLGGENYAEDAQEAMKWYKKCMTLDRWNGYAFLRYGMCLDWIGQADQSDGYYAEAYRLDPCGYFTVAHVGLHHVQLRNYAAAREWFERSMLLNWDNQIAKSYLDICEARLMDQATNSISLYLPAAGAENTQPEKFEGKKP